VVLTGEQGLHLVIGDSHGEQYTGDMHGEQQLTGA